uniref:Inter-alpha-trypsin inhibitor heavy chain H3-like isoform X2 n=1 Tax=Crassostrea virginica TaxID=6565 RepID=A0A8B8BAH8_CRAVI|nr:inter-alpha-trypsin inhibitor heavy chain H3-like isoform X2 [Crassostrea virginica]
MASWINTVVLCILWSSILFGCDGQVLQKPSIYYLHVISDIRFRFATTLVTSKIANPANTSQEVRFDVTLPDEAFISDFQMEIGGKIYPGEVNEKKVAQKRYDEAKKKGQSAGQVKQKETNRFSVEVNVGAKEKVVFNLTYQELLKRKRGSYEHVIFINPQQIVKDFQIYVSIQESRDITSVRVPPLRDYLVQNLAVEDSLTDNALAVINRPNKQSAQVTYSPSETDQRQQSSQGISGRFVVEYDIDRKTDAGDVLVVDGYFVHFFAPSDMREIPKDVLLILDVSRSMYGTKVAQMKQAVLGILSDLHEGDRFNILRFSDQVYFYSESPVMADRKSIAKAKRFVNKMSTLWGTNINLGMLEGIDFFNKADNTTERAQVIFFLTDGEPTSGETRAEIILENVRSKNSKVFPVYSLAFGRSADYEFVKKVAAQNNGLSRKIYEDSDATLQIKGFYDEVSAAVLKDVTFKYLDNGSSVQNLTEISFPSYFSGSEIVVAGKIEDNNVRLFDLSVEGLGSNGAVELSLSADVNDQSYPELIKPGDYVKITEKIWAYLTIKQLLQRSVAETETEVKERLKEQALELSLKYKFVTPLTSMVVVKPQKKDVPDLKTDEKTNENSKSQSSFAPPSPNRGGTGSSYGGGAGGDPHFMVRVRGLEYPVCFDLHAESGDVLRLLSDRETGLFINAGIIPSFKLDSHQRMKTFMGEIVILYETHVLKVTPNKILYDGAELFWSDGQPYNFNDLVIEIVTIRGCRVIRVDFGNNVQITIKRTIASVNMAVDYLNLYIENEAGLSNSSDGILGQFLHRFVFVEEKGRDKKNRTVGELLIRDNGAATNRFQSILVERPEEITGIQELCWKTHTLLTKTDKRVRHFFIKDIMQL